MAHQNIQFIKILYAKINQGKNKTFMHNERFIHTILSKNPTVLSLHQVQDTLEFSTALTSVFSLLTITMTSQHVYKS